MTPKAKGRPAGTGAAFKTALETHHSAQPVDEQGSKSFAMLLFNVGASSLAETRRKFDANPAWRHA